MKLIIVDGLDGVGKDTHAQLIKEYYEDKGYSVKTRSHPSTDTFFGRNSKKALLGQGMLNKIKASMFYALDVLHSIRYYYHRGDHDIIIMVRYLMGTAYLPTALVKTGYTFFEHFVPTSPYMFFLDAKPETLFKRIQERENMEIFETLEALERVRIKALSVATSWNIVDTSGSIEDTANHIQNMLKLLDKKMEHEDTVSS